MRKHFGIAALVAISVIVAAFILLPPASRYESSAMRFSLLLPAGYTADESYHYGELGPGKEIRGVKFTIPEARAAGTNLASDSYLSVEELPQAVSCTAGLFLPQSVAARSFTDGAVDYSLASSTGAVAGNRYEETVYALQGTDPCLAVRYLIHYGVFENYLPGAVREFDRRAILDEFDAIRRTLLVKP